MKKPKRLVDPAEYRQARIRELEARQELAAVLDVEPGEVVEDEEVGWWMSRRARRSQDAPPPVTAREPNALPPDAQFESDAVLGVGAAFLAFGLEAQVEPGAQAEATAVFEFGCGTGRLAERLLSRHLPERATYTAVDISDTMFELTRERLAPWGSRTEVRLTAGDMDLDAAGSSHDRFVCAYVFDLLSVDDIHKLLGEARHVLRPGGLLCLASLTAGHGFGAKLATGLWRLAYLIAPASWAAVGRSGCGGTSMRSIGRPATAASSAPAACAARSWSRAASRTARRRSGPPALLSGPSRLDRRIASRFPWRGGIAGEGRATMTIEREVGAARRVRPRS